MNADQIKITSKGDTTLKGAQATANRIDADVGKNLNIISQQDTLNQDSKQMGVGARVQVSLGTAWDASGNFNNSSAKGNSKSVKQQSGLFAGDGGYHVKADHVDLQGGAIASTASKENNDLTANSLKFSNIENESSHNATTVALSGGTRFGEEKGKDSTGAQYTNNVNWRESTTFSPTLPQQDKDSDSSTTYATISEGNINIGGKDTTVKELGMHSDINTANQQVAEVPDLQAILDKQKIVSDATSTIVAATRTYSQNKQAEAEKQKQATEQQALEKLQAEGGEKWAEYNSTKDNATKQDILKSYSEEYKSAADQAQAWGMGGSSSRALNAVTIAITAALGGQTDLQAVSNALAPYAAQVIGQEFGHGEDKNTTAQMVAHALLGATLAYINGGDPTAGGSAAVASEAAANYLTNQYKDDPRYKDAHGEFQPNLLPEDVKAQIRDLTAGIGAVIGGAVGDSSYNAQLAGVIGQNAVENNGFNKGKGKQYSNCVSQGGSRESCAQSSSGLVAYKDLGKDEQEAIYTLSSMIGANAIIDCASGVSADCAISVLETLNPGRKVEAAIDAYKAAKKAGDTQKATKAVNEALSYCSGNACFTAGTLIETKDGLKAVEQFSGGELIWSRNENTLEYGYKPVIATKVTENQTIFEVLIENGQGIQETLETTEEHPFWIKGYGWLKASLLQSGMTLLDRNNEELIIISQHLVPHKIETVYNIEVDGFHTYHVGELGVWVHNANCCTKAFTATKEATKAAKALGFSKIKDYPFNSHGQAVYKKGNTYITPDVDGHNGGVWKIFDRKGNRIGTADANLNIFKD